jgi:hypothetical protein
MMMTLNCSYSQSSPNWGVLGSSFAETGDEMRSQAENSTQGKNSAPN